MGSTSLVIAVGVPLILIALIVPAIFLGSRRGSVGNYIGLAGIIFAAAAPLIHTCGVVFGVIGWAGKNTRSGIAITGMMLNLVLGASGLILIYFFLTNLTWGFR